MHFIDGNAFSNEYFNRCVEIERAHSPNLPDETIAKIVTANLADDIDYYADELNEPEDEVYERAELDFGKVGFGDAEENEDD
jgi:hypothetical protein